MKNIITISRQFGAGGSSIGRKVADRLGYYYCDKDMIIRAALESGTLTIITTKEFQLSSGLDRASSTSTTGLWTNGCTKPNPLRSKKWLKKETASL